MDPMSIQQFINPEMVILVGVCYALGLFLKNAPKIPDWIIPYILLVFNIVLAIVYIATVIEHTFNFEVVLSGFIYGLMSAAVAVYGNQLVKQTIKKR